MFGRRKEIEEAYKSGFRIIECMLLSVLP